MTFTWNPAAKMEMNPGVNAPTICHVLYEFDGPKMVLARDESQRQVLGIAIDEDLESGYMRWIYALITPKECIELLKSDKKIRDVIDDRTVEICDLDRELKVVHKWRIDSSDIPEEYLPESESGIPELLDTIRSAIEFEQGKLLASKTALARAQLFFSGKPVVGKRAISLDFATNILGNYQALVSAAYSGRRHGTLGTRGPIPDRSSSHLYLAEMPRGSVGFELVEISDQGFLDKSPLAEVVAEVGDLIESAAQGDQEFADSIADFDQRVHPTLREFFGLLKRAEVSFRLETNEKIHTLDLERIRIAADRTNIDPKEELDIPINGQLIGFMPIGRRFEFRLESGEIIRGKIARDAIDGIRHWFEKECTAHMRVVTVVRSGGETKAFTLLHVSPLDSPIP